MAHEIAKLMLEHAGTFLERTEAIRVALLVGYASSRNRRVPRLARRHAGSAANSASGE